MSLRRGRRPPTPIDELGRRLVALGLPPDTITSVKATSFESRRLARRPVLHLDDRCQAGRSWYSRLFTAGGRPTMRTRSLDAGPWCRRCASADTVLARAAVDGGYLAVLLGLISDAANCYPSGPSEPLVVGTEEQWRRGADALGLLGRFPNVVAHFPDAAGVRSEMNAALDVHLVNAVPGEIAHWAARRQVAAQHPVAPLPPGSQVNATRQVELDAAFRSWARLPLRSQDLDDFAGCRTYWDSLADDMVVPGPLMLVGVNLDIRSGLADDSYLSFVLGLWFGYRGTRAVVIPEMALPVMEELVIGSGFAVSSAPIGHRPGLTGCQLVEALVDDGVDLPTAVATAARVL